VALFFEDIEKSTACWRDIKVTLKKQPSHQLRVTNNIYLIVFQLTGCLFLDNSIKFCEILNFITETKVTNQHLGSATLGDSGNQSFPGCRGE